jgi:hypothetical protein
MGQRTSLNKPSTDVHCHDKCFEESEGLLTALGHVWILRFAHALGQIFGFLQENQTNGVDTGTGTGEQMDDKDYEKCFDADKAPRDGSNQAK